MSQDRQRLHVRQRRRGRSAMVGQGFDLSHVAYPGPPRPLTHLVDDQVADGAPEPVLYAGIGEIVPGLDLLEQVDRDILSEIVRGLVRPRYAPPLEAPEELLRRRVEQLVAPQQLLPGV